MEEGKRNEYHKFTIKSDIKSYICSSQLSFYIKYSASKSNLKIATGIALSVTGAPAGKREIIKLQFSPVEVEVQIEEVK